MTMSLAAGSVALICDEENKLYLSEGDAVRGSADSANLVDYTIMGVERDA